MARRDHPLIGARTLTDLAQAEWALPAADFNNEQDLTHIFLERGLPAPRVALEACTALSMMLTLAADYFCDLLRREI